MKGFLLSVALTMIALPVFAEAPIAAEAVDLGLSVKWASCNVGANAPEQYGGLFGWGNPDAGATSENFEDYPTATPPASICGSEYDIATANWGSEWRMPTQAECKELASQCSWEWSTVNGINGMTVTGKNGNSIFLPAGATRTGAAVSNQVGQRGNYWSGTLCPDNSNFASYLYFYSDATRVQPARSNRRYIGMSVRPVLDEAGAGLNEAESDSPTMIYDMMGNLLYSGTNPRLTNPGVYLVKTNNVTKKILVRP